MHEHRIPNFLPVFSILVASSSRTKEDDTSGGKLLELLKEKGYGVSSYNVVKDDSELIKSSALEMLQDSDALIISGGTGMSKRDFTIQAIRSISSKEMTGFAHVFSILSFQEIGTPAIMSNATAFVVRDKPVFCLPGSPSGAMAGLEKIILREIDHVVHELNK